MSDYEFKVTPKTAKLTIGEKSYIGRFPFHGERKDFMANLKDVDPEQATAVIEDFFVSLGFPRDAILLEMDGGDFQNFMTFILSGGSKKN